MKRLSTALLTAATLAVGLAPSALATPTDTLDMAKVDEAAADGAIPVTPAVHPNDGAMPVVLASAQPADGPVPEWAAVDAGPSETTAEAAPGEGSGAAADESAGELDPEDPIGLAGRLYNAIDAGAWLLALGVGIMLLVFVARRILTRWFDFLATRKGGYLLNFGGAYGLSLATAAAAQVDPSPTLFLGVLVAAFSAAGGWGALTDRWPGIAVASVSRKSRDRRA